jgi:hypothetical protein
MISIRKYTVCCGMESKSGRMWGIAEAYYKGVPEHIINETMKIIPHEFKEIIEQFRERYL